MAKKESTIIYDKQVDICEKFLTYEQFGRLMFGLRKMNSGEAPDFSDDKMLDLAFAFMSLQKELDDDKYKKKCETNKENGKKGGRPKKNPEKPNGYFQNPNENENENDKENEKENENDSGLSLFGSLSNIELTPGEYQSIVDTYEDPNGLIDKVSRWLPTAKHTVPDHYEAILSFANKSGWSKRRILKPPPPEREIDPEDMLTEEEQAEMVAALKRKIGFNVIG